MSVHNNGTHKGELRTTLEVINIRWGTESLSLLHPDVTGEDILAHVPLGWAAY